MNPSPSPLNSPSPAPQASYLNRTRSTIRQALNLYSAYQRAAKQQPGLAPAQSLKADMDRLSTTLKKLEEGIVRVAVFGLVSRGKSAVLNALVGQKLLPTGPLNGVTLEPQSVTWRPDRSTDQPIQQIELIDTPGLDEIDGQTRAQMAQEVARQADLILFVVSGDITRTEYQALCELRQAQKPLLLVFNKIDLYPDRSRQAIYQNLQQLAAKTQSGEALQLISAEEIVLVAADPMPLQVRVERPNGQVSHEWETPPTQIQDLRQKILAILNRDARTLMALNALFQVRDAETHLTTHLLELHQAQAEDLIWQFVRYKSLAIALNPIALLDMAGGVVSDLAMIRALSELYGLPVTRYEASKLWKTILLSSGGLLLAEWGSGLLFGVGKSAAAVAAGTDSATGFSAYAGAAITQAAIAGFGTYSVGRAIQVYLENGCSWGSQGANTTIQEILAQIDRTTILYRLRADLSQQFGFPYQ